MSLEVVNAENPFRLALTAFTKEEGKEATRKMIQENPDYQRLATVAEKFDNLLIRKFYKLLSFGMLMRMNESELLDMEKKCETNDTKTDTLKKAMAEAEKEFDKLALYVEENINYQVVPIKKLVSIQLECGVLMADYLK
jgi:hypothetical protein